MTTQRRRWTASLVPLSAVVALVACGDAGAPEPVARTESAVSVASASKAPFAYPGIVRPPGRSTVAASVRAPHGVEAASYPPTGGCGTALAYYGGPIIAAPTVVQVSWNLPTSSVASTVQTYLQSWWPAIISSQAGYLSWLSEYDTAGKTGVDGLAGSNQTFRGYGTYGGLYPITPSVANQGATVDNSAIGTELVAQIEAGHLPQPTFDAAGHCNTIYMIDFPPGVTDISMTFAGTVGNSCTDFCGFHFGTPFGTGKYIYYGVLPDMTSACTACAPDGVQQDVGMVHSHELAEAMTDAEIGLEALTGTSTDFLRPGGWDQIASGCSEIGDSCAWPSTVPTVTYNGASYYVQGLFDNARMDCEVSGPTTVCTSNATCTNPAAPNCDTATGACVGCLSNTNCTGATPICDATAQTCRACQPADCTGAKPVCETSGTSAGQCVQCDTDANCSGSTPICDATSHSCRGCTANADCASGTNKACDAATGLCVACMTNTDCSHGVCDTANHTCQQCLDNTECSNPAPICGSSDTCRTCVSDPECQASSSGHACSPSGSCVQCTASNETACTGGRVCDVATATCVNAAVDAGAEGGADAGTHTGHDAGVTEAGVETEAGVDSGAAGNDASMEPDAGAEADASAGFDSGSVATGDAGAASEGGTEGEAGTGSSNSGGSGGGCSVGVTRAGGDFAPAVGFLFGLAVVARGRRKSRR